MRRLLTLILMLIPAVTVVGQDDLSDAEIEAMLMDLEGLDQYERQARAIADMSRARLDELFPRLTEVIGRYDQVSISTDVEDGSIEIVMPNAVLFDSGSNFLRPLSERMLREIRLALMETVDYADFLRIDVVGHTDTDKRIGDPAYVVLPATPQNLRLAHQPGEHEPVEGMTVREWGVDPYIAGRPYRLVPVSPDQFAVVSNEGGTAAEAYQYSYMYNYVLGIERATVVQRYFFDSGDIEGDDAFSQYSRIQVHIDSRGFLEPVVPNDPLQYTSERDANRGRELRRPNRRVEIHITVWDAGIQNHVSMLRQRDEAIQASIEAARERQEASLF